MFPLPNTMSEADQKDERYVPGQSCPYCFKTPAEQMAFNIAQRHEAIRRATTPLPGTQPRENYKSINVPRDCDGATMLDALCRVVKQAPRTYWESECARGLVVDVDRKPVAATQIVRAGERYRICFQT